LAVFLFEFAFGNIPIAFDMKRVHLFYLFYGLS
jgi:hypothetical protein